MDKEYITQCNKELLEQMKHLIDITDPSNTMDLYKLISGLADYINQLQAIN